MWKQGPMPSGTWNWGAVVLEGMDPKNGFYFADFCGDHVKLVGVEECISKTIPANKIAWYNNSLELPPTGATSRINLKPSV